MNGNLGQDLGDPYAMLPGMGEYVSSDSYLDDENSRAQELLKPDLAASTGSVANAPKVTVGMDGIDGHFGVGSADPDVVVEQAGVDTPVFARDSLRQLGPKGPMTARTARLDTRPLGQPRVSEIGNKNYEVPSVSKALRSERGQQGTTVVDSRKSLVTVETDTPGQNKVSQKTCNEEASEIEALKQTIDGLSGSFIPGLGYMGEEADKNETGIRAGLLAWWARFKARLASARAGWAKERARQARREGNTQAIKALDAVAVQEEQNSKVAAEAALKAGQITHQMARQDPVLAESIAVAEQAANEEAEAMQSIDGGLGSEISRWGRTSQSSVFADRRQAAQLRQQGVIKTQPVMEQNKRMPPQRTTGPRSAADLKQRGLVFHAKRLQILEEKLRLMTDRLRQCEARKGRSWRQAFRRLWSRRRAATRPVLAPVPVQAVRRPEERGRSSMFKRIAAPTEQRQALETAQQDVQIKQAVGGFLDTKFMGLPAPLLLAGAGIGAYLFLKHKK